MSAAISPHAASAPAATAAAPAAAAAPRYRAVRVGGSLTAQVTRRDDATVLIASTEALREPARRITDRLLHWASVAPDRTLAARRAATPGGARDGDWVRLSYADAWARARRVAQSLLDLGASVERPVAILSDNDLEHLLMALGALIAGVPFAPISSAYSLVSQDFAKLRHVLGLLTPGVVFASDARYATAIMAVVPGDTPVVLSEGEIQGRGTLSFAGLLNNEATTAVDAAHAAVVPDTVTKILFTSGSTALPKGVINTHRMWCSNQQQMLQCLPFLGEAPPVLVDWLVWNHTFGGNHNLGLVLYNGGSFYIDEGRPTPKGIAQTLRNLREIAPTIYFNVPRGFEEIIAALEADVALRERFFSDLKACYFAGAGLSQAVWDRFDAVAERHAGERIRMLSGLGMTETSPFALCANAELATSGVVGLPAPGMVVKLAAVDGKLEARYRGPNVTPGYWRAEEATLAAFDDEGYFRSGDALAFVDPDRPEQGLRFDGRVAEDFKLSTGTFVSVGPLRAKIVAAGEPCVQDAVITGMNRDDIGALIFPRPDACRQLAGLDAGASLADALASRTVREFFQALADRLFQQGTGSASRVARLQVLVEPPAIDRGELTDKGSINQRAVLSHRAALAEALYADPAAHVGESPVFLPRRCPSADLPLTAR